MQLAAVFVQRVVTAARHGKARGAGFFFVVWGLAVLGIAELAKTALAIGVVNAMRATGYRTGQRNLQGRFPQTVSDRLRGKRKGPALEGRPFFMVEIS